MGAAIELLANKQRWTLSRLQVWTAGGAGTIDAATGASNCAKAAETAANRRIIEDFILIS